MAIVILFGLLTSTALNMIVVPALYLRFGQIGRNKLGNATSTSIRGTLEAGLETPGA